MKESMALACGAALTSFVLIGLGAIASIGLIGTSDRSRILPVETPLPIRNVPATHMSAWVVAPLIPEQLANGSEPAIDVPFTAVSGPAVVVAPKHNNHGTSIVSAY